MGFFGRIVFLFRVHRLASTLGSSERALSEGRFEVIADELWRSENPREAAKQRLFKLTEDDPTLWNGGISVFPESDSIHLLMMSNLASSTISIVDHRSVSRSLANQRVEQTAFRALSLASLA